MFFPPFYCLVLGSGGGEKSMCTQMAYPPDPSFQSLNSIHYYRVSHRHQNKRMNTIIKRAVIENMMLLTSWGIITTVLPKTAWKTSYFGFILTFMEKQSEYLLIGHRFVTYGMDYSHEILTNYKKHILGDFRGIWVSYRKEGPTSKLPDIIK